MSSKRQASILLVEDEPIVAMDVQRRLQQLGYSVPLAVASGEEAVRRAPEVAPDIILMDIMLQGEIDGIEATARIRRERQIPVIYLTAYADQEILERAKITEPFGYILKPFEDRELLTCIEMALYKHAMELKLQENERWHTTTLQSIGDAVIATDAAGLVRLFNPVAEKLTGRSSEQVLGHAFSDILELVREQDGAAMGARLLQDEETHCHGDHCLLLRSGHGEERAVEVTVSPLKDNGAGHAGAVYVLRDITEGRRAQEALKAGLRQLRRTLEETVSALAMTAEKRDPYTAGHQQRVARLASAVAQQMGLSEERIEGLRVASLLHDIGKIYIPAEILSKPARLSDMEMGLMRTHSEVGHDILKGVSFPWPVAEMVLQHHERLDGSGYPHGLKGEEILLEARILMVADVVEAMSSHRPYRAALGLDKALNELLAGRGRSFDPDVVAACLHCFRANGFSFES